MPTKGGGELVEAETLLIGSISMCWIAELPSRRLLFSYQVEGGT
jgi:hypothetical protein